MTLDLAADQDVFFADFADDTGNVNPVTGDPRTGVAMLINRKLPEVEGDGGARIRSYHIGLKNSATKGLTADEALQQSDGQVATLDFPESVGDAQAKWINRPINRLINQNAGMLLVEVLL